MRNVITALAIFLLIGGLLVLFSGSAIADIFVVEEDFLTGGGWILTTAQGTHLLAKANFGVGGGVRNGNWWGHLNYIDHGNGLHVHGTEVTGYFRPADTLDSTDPKTGQPHGTRVICGIAETNNPAWQPSVRYRVRAADNSEPGVNDIFIIRLFLNGVEVYSTQGSENAEDDDTLGGTRPGGGNINLHKHNASNVGPGTPPDCPGAEPPPI